VALRTQVLAEGLVFTEGPRWHRGRLWCSDMHDHRIVAVDTAGAVETIATLEGDEPSGLGWLPDGRLLVVSMERQWVMRLETDGTLVCHADLSGPSRGSLNDMIVADDGTAYVGDMGGRIHGGTALGPGQVFAVRPDGSYAVAQDEMAAPNGLVLSPDERTLMVAESAGLCVTAFDRADDGTLHNRRTFAQLVPSDPVARVSAPDGICMDAEGAVWVADPVGRRVLRVRDGGGTTDIVGIPDLVPVACVLGGADRRTLYVCAAATWHRNELVGTRTGQILQILVTVPGAGKP